MRLGAIDAQLEAPHRFTENRNLYKPGADNHLKDQWQSRLTFQDQHKPYFEGQSVTDFPSLSNSIFGAAKTVPQYSRDQSNHLRYLYKGVVVSTVNPLTPPNFVKVTGLINSNKQQLPR